MHEATSPNMTLSPGYHQAVNVITQPDRMVFTSRYLVEKWLPDLGGDGLAILLFLRRQCYHNRKTGELRNTVQLNLADIARGCAISVNTARRQLQNNQALRAFVSWREEFVVEEKRKGLIQTGNSYTVSMDDPLHPSDQPRLEAELRRREEDARPEDPKQRARRQAQERAEGHAPTPSQHGTPLEAATDSQNGIALPRPAPSHFGGALREAQRTPILGDESKDYSALLKTNKTTTTEPDMKPKDTVVVASAAALVSALVAEGIPPKAARNLLDQHGKEAVRQQLEWLPLRKHDPQKGTLAGLLRTAIEEDWNAPLAKKVLPCPKVRVAANRPAERPQETPEDTATRRAVLEKAKQQLRIGSGGASQDS